MRNSQARWCHRVRCCLDLVLSDLDMDVLSVAGLREYMEGQGISLKTLDNLSSNMVSGLALTLLDESELKELVLIIGDRAVL